MKEQAPKGRNSDEVMHNISDVATDPASEVSVGSNGNNVVEGTRGGIHIRVIIAGPNGWYGTPAGEIVTRFPTNVARNHFDVVERTTSGA